MTGPLEIVVLGLSLSSSWGNGHATTWRSLLKGLAGLGHRVLFLERDVPWYAAHRDLADPPFCRFALYADLGELARRHAAAIARADAVVVGSYVPEGVAAFDLVLATARGPVLFYDIDTPVTLAALTAGQATYIEPRQIPRLDAYLSFAGGPTLKHLQAAFGAQRAVPLHCSVDPELYRPTDVEPMYDLGYLGTYSPDRQPALERLLLEPARRMPQRRFVVGGSGYPRDTLWPANVARIDHVAPSGHAAFYGSQCMTLNLTRADMRAAGWSPSVRLFEAAACGTAVISDRWPGIDTFFPEGEAIFLADITEDVLRLLSLPRDAVRGVATAARRLVLAGHTGAARAGTLVACLRELMAAREGAAQVAP